ncbi:MAG: molybdate ABC transporter permease subunit [Sutterellaceae bacterium]|nr:MULTISPECIES: molybdate ABC transporter permease subunit [unclassified Limnobacter]MAG82003.1 molybdate ABC transporter permease subunit [Sutterellaceae bacterium]MBT82955.1 molybdate ABC transporter permease subunit [Sutterellaceae bacterium]HAV74984.1 molybdate ABC transporter permease subunit [Limnobacter sp.]
MDWSAFSLSIQLALGTLLVLLPVGLLAGRWLARTPFKGRTWIEAAILLPLVLPPTVMGYYLLLAVGGGSPVGQWLQNTWGISLTFNFAGLLLASVLFNIPFMLQPIQRAFESIPHNLNEAAQVSGLSTWAVFTKVELPLAWPGILSAMVLTFVHTLGEFGVVLMIGGSIPGETRTLAISIYDSVQSFDLNAANTMSLALLMFSLVAVATSLLLSGRKRRKP